MVKQFSFLLTIIFFLILSIVFLDFFSNLKKIIPMLLGLIIFFMGMTVDLKEFKNSLKKPQWVILTVFLQFTVMPSLAFFIAKTMNLSSELALGFIILGSCPGGTASNVITYLCGGDVPLSILCTFTSTILSIFLTPYLILFLTDENVIMNVNMLILSTSKIVLFPLLIGLVVRFFFLELVNKVKFIFPTLSEIIISIVIAIIFSLNIDSLKEISIYLLFGIFFHNLGGLIMGYFIAGYFNIPEASRRAVSIEVGMQNSGLGMALAMIDFTKVVALPAAIFSLWHNISASVLVYLSKKK